MAQHTLQYKRAISDAWHTDDGYNTRQGALEAGMALFQSGYERVYVDGVPLANPTMAMGRGEDTEPPALSAERLELTIAKRLFADDLKKIGTFADVEAVWRLLDVDDQWNYQRRAEALIDFVEA